MERDPFVQSFQTLTVQYDVQAIDGSTPSQPFTPFDESADNFIAPNDQGIYVVEQERVGLIDPDQGTGGAMGDRFMPWFEVCRDDPDSVEVAIVDGEDPSKVLEIIEPLTPITPDAPLYRSVFFRCPQGGLIRVRSAAEGPGKIRFRVLLECEPCCPPKNGGGGGGTGPAGPTGPTGPTGPAVNRSITRHFNSWYSPGEAPPTPWQLDFASDWALSGPPPTATRPASPCFNWIADAPGRLAKVTVLHVNDLLVPASLTVSFQVGSPPFAFVAGAPPMLPFPLPVAAVVGPALIGPGSPVDFIIPPALSAFLLHDMLGVFVDGWAAGPISGASVQAMATCQWESP